MAEEVRYLNAWSPRLPTRAPLSLRHNGGEGGGAEEEVSTELKLFSDSRKVKKKPRHSDVDGSSGCNGSGGEGGGAEKEVSTELKLFTDPWTIKKKLTHSDVDGSSRLLLSAADVRDHMLPYLGEGFEAKRGGSVRIWDNDTETEHVLELKQWNSHSYVLINNWRKEFKSRRGLERGDEIGLFWNRFSSNFYFGLLKKNPKWNL